MVYFGLLLIVVAWFFQLTSYIRRKDSLNKIFLLLYSIGVSVLVLDSIFTQSYFAGILNCVSLILAVYLYYLRIHAHRHSLFSFLKIRKKKPDPFDSESFLGSQVVVVLLLLSFLSFGIWSSQNKSVFKPKINIGLNLELSGSLSSVGNSSKRSAELMAKQINDAGGLLVNGNRYLLNLIIRDNKSDVHVTRQVTNELIYDENVVAMIGPNASSYAVEAAQIAEENKVLMISPWSTAQGTTINNRTATPKQYVFRAAFLDSFQGKALAKFAYETLSARKAALFYDNDASVLKGQAENFRNQFDGLGGKITVAQTFSENLHDYQKELQQIKNAKVDVIFLPGYYSDSIEIIRKAHEMNIETPFLGSDAWGNNDLLSACAADCEGYYLSGHYSVDSNQPKTIQFVRAYQEVYREEPDDVAALTYDSMGMLIYALRNTDSLVRQSIRDALSEIGEYNGATGRLQFDSDSRDPRKSVVIKQIQDNSFKFITTIEP
jgi:branched-chain amino acid transport system substrate-binding protein